MKIDRNLIPISTRAKAAFAAVVESVRSAAYKNPTAAKLAERNAPGKLAAVVDILLTNAYVADLTSPGQPGERAVVCPTGRKWFEADNRYLPPCFDRPETVVRALDGLHEANYVTATKGTTGRPSMLIERNATEFALRPNGRQRIGSLDLADFGPREGMEVVLLKAKEEVLLPEDQKPDALGALDYDDTPDTKAMRAFTQKLNTHLSHHRPIYDGTACVPGFTYVQRMFNGSFDYVGRYSGHWCQFIPKAERAFLSIDGQPVTEVDFHGTLLSLAYHSRGLELPDGNLYDYGVHDLGRPAGAYKRATIALLMRNRRSDRFPAKIKRETHEDGRKTQWFPEDTKWSDVESVILTKHAALKPFLFKSDEWDLGLRLMRRESDILTRAMETLIAADIGFVPIHDGILCPVNRADEVQSAMVAAYVAVMGKQPRIARKACGSPKPAEAAPAPVVEAVVPLYDGLDNVAPPELASVRPYDEDDGMLLNRSRAAAMRRRS